MWGGVVHSGAPQNMALSLHKGGALKLRGLLLTVGGFYKLRLFQPALQCNERAYLRVLLRSTDST